MFEEVSSKVDFKALERDVLAWWQKNGIMEKYLVQNDDSDQRFSFIDGPITANNPMGVHHAWGRSYKDLFQRFKTMQGYKQRYQNGFDGQGLWIEVEVEKELGFKSKRDIEAYGVDRFVELCKERVKKFSDIITRQSIRLGHWAHWDKSYHTMSDENNYTIWYFLKKCHEKGWIYEGRDVMPWCPRCGTGLSQHEIVTEGYKEIIHPGLYVKFPLIDLPRCAANDRMTQASLLIWTTTPWTLTSNVAAAVHPDKTYIEVKEGDDVLYLIKECAEVLKGDYEIQRELRGQELVGLRYSGPFDELPAQYGVEHKVVPSDEVNENEGTGIVHTAPGAGQEDFALGKEFGLETIAPLDESGDFIEGFGWLTGMNVYTVNDSIYASLKKKDIFYNLEQYSHRYPVCWRCDSELVFRLVDEWFISMDELRHKIAEVTKKIRWIPSFGMDRELDWLRNMQDWMISKKRFWGLALPIYKCECGWFDVLGSEEELEKRSIEGWDEFKGQSPHRPWIDTVKIKCQSCDKMVNRIKDVGNPWLDAGIVTFSTIRYRQDKNYWRQWFPADWISESFPGQFRNWFYSLLTMSTALENEEPFRTVFSYALMRDENGEEMHKSKGNAIWFEDAADRMGVDTMRWLYARQNPAANLNFGFSAGDEVRRRFIIPLWNVYAFFVTYANIDEYDPSTVEPEIETRPEIDRWIISELNGLVEEVTDALENYEPERAARNAEHFVGYLSNWYVRRSRRRFWKTGVLSRNGSSDKDKLCAYATLYTCLTTLAKLLAPIIPFVTEAMYQNLSGRCFKSNSIRKDKTFESIHLDSYPKADLTLVDPDLSNAVRLAMRLSSLGRAARSKVGLKVRQPLEAAFVKLSSPEEVDLLDKVSVQIRDELNVKRIVLFSEETKVLDYRVQGNMAKLGPKYGGNAKTIAAALSEINPSEVEALLSSKLNVEVGDYIVQADEVDVTSSEKEGFSVVSGSDYTVAVTTEISSDLAMEGQARELVHRIQNMRRSSNFDISDHIVTYYHGSPTLDEIVISHGTYIRQETLSRRLINSDPSEGSYIETYSVDGIDAILGVKKI